MSGKSAKERKTMSFISWGGSLFITGGLWRILEDDMVLKGNRVGVN